MSQGEWPCEDSRSGGDKNPQATLPRVLEPISANFRRAQLRVWVMRNRFSYCWPDRWPFPEFDRLGYLSLYQNIFALSNVERDVRYTGNSYVDQASSWHGQVAEAAAVNAGNAWLKNAPACAVRTMHMATSYLTLKQACHELTLRLRQWSISMEVTAGRVRLHRWNRLSR